MRLLLPLALALSAVAQPAFAQDSAQSESAVSPALQQRGDDVVAYMKGEKDASEIFNPSFLGQVPAAQLASITAQLRAQFGEVIGVESIDPSSAHAANITFRFEKALGSGTITLDADEPYMISGLLLQKFEPIGDNADKILSEIRALPGSTSAYFGPLDGASPTLAHNTQEQFAIGSTFKLYVLSALARSIEAGERKWRDVVPLSRQSFPSGMMQNWPTGAPATLQTYATMMISISDNTATDQLIHILGREAVEAEMELIGHSALEKNKPFLTTLEMFALKGSPFNMGKYIAADEAGKRFILADFEDDIGGDPSKVELKLSSNPTAIDTLEWFANTGDLQLLGQRLASLTDPTARSVMSANIALPASTAEEWQYVGYKGGSEPGVLNMTWLLQDTSDQWHLLALSWNNDEAEVDTNTLLGLAHRIIALD